MAQPVWILSVDLQTKTATFQSGMAEAAKSARGSFQDIKTSAAEMSSSTKYSMREANEAVIALGEQFGVHLPSAITRSLAGLAALGPALEAALPVAALALGITLLLEHIKKVREEEEKLTESQLAFGTTAQNVLNGLKDKLLEAGIHADELNGDHLAALRKQLELIDHQSLNELTRALDTVSKAADGVFSHLKAAWYQEGIGSDGARHALEQFKEQYDSLIAQGKGDQASGLLSGTLAQAQRVLALQQQMKTSQSSPDQGWHGDTAKYEEAKNALKQYGVGITDKEVSSQQALVNALNEQVEVQRSVNSLKAAQDSNAVNDEKKEYETITLIGRHSKALDELAKKQKEQAEAAGEAQAHATDEFTKAMAEQQKLQNKQNAEAGKEAADHTYNMGELKIAAQKEADALATSSRVQTLEQQAALEQKYADEEYQNKLAHLRREIEALDSTSPEYLNKVKALNDRETELTQQHENQITAIKNKAEEERNRAIMAGEMRLREDVAKGLTDVLMRHQSFAAMMSSIGNEVASGMMKNALMSMMTLDMTKEKEAAAAARKGWLAGMSFPWPVNIAMAPSLAALGFASVMAFEGGGIVPGVERGDVVNAKLEPGETVLPKRMTERLSKATDSDDNRPHMTVQHRPTYHIHAIDGASVRGMLQKHGDDFHKHFERTLRKMNR